MRHYPIETADLPVSFTMSAGSPTERVEPVTLATAKLHLKVQSTSEDTLIAAYIAAARAYFEEQTGRQTINAVFEYSLDVPPSQRFIEIPRPPMDPSGLTVKYDDANGTEQTLDASNYAVAGSFLDATAIDPYCQPGRLELLTTGAWPTTRIAPRSLRIRRTCGYGEADTDMPGTIQAAILLLVGHLYRNRAEVSEPQRQFQQLPMGAQVLIDAFKWTALTRPPVTYFRYWPDGLRCL